MLETPAAPPMMMISAWAEKFVASRIDVNTVWNYRTL